MTQKVNKLKTGQPTLEALMLGFLAKRSDAAFAGAVESASGDVEPYEVAAGFRVDPQAAWSDALSALPEVAVSSVPSPKPAKGLPIPPEWPALVGQPAADFAVAYALGSFPQRVKDLQPLLTKTDLTTLRPTGNHLPSPSLSGLRTWIIREAKKQQPGPLLLAAGVARTIGEFDWAGELLASAETQCSGKLRAAWENERAALLWHTGRGTEALAAWQAMADSAVVSFNCGMAKLFLGDPRSAESDLRQAADLLPETNGWCALARLYLVLSEIAE